MLIYGDNGATTAFGGLANYKSGNKQKRVSISAKVSKGKRRTKKRRAGSKRVKNKIKSLTAKNKNFLKTLGIRVKKH